MLHNYLLFGVCLQLFDVNYYQGKRVPAGKQFYLNCQEKTAANTPPTAPILSSNCQYPIPTETAAGSYVFHIYASDGTTLLGTSTPITVTIVEPTHTPVPTATPVPIATPTQRPINPNDETLLFQCFGHAAIDACQTVDYNSDGIIGGLDYLIFLQNH